MGIMEKKMETTVCLMWGSPKIKGAYYNGESKMEKKMEHEMETGIYRGL